MAKTSQVVAPPGSHPLPSPADCFCRRGCILEGTRAKPCAFGGWAECFTGKISMLHVLRIMGCGYCAHFLIKTEQT